MGIRKQNGTQRCRSVECLTGVLAIADVHGYFKAKTHFGSLGLGPHDDLLLLFGLSDGNELFACHYGYQYTRVFQ